MPGPAEIGVLNGDAGYVLKFGESVVENNRSQGFPRLQTNSRRFLTGVSLTPVGFCPITRNVAASNSFAICEISLPRPCVPNRAN